MKTVSFIVFMTVLISCSSTQYFCRTWTDKETGQQMLSDTVVYIKPYGIINLWAKEKEVKYKMKWGNLVCGVAFAPTVIIPAVMWGFLLFEADTIDGDKYQYVKVNPDEL